MNIRTLTSEDRKAVRREDEGLKVATDVDYLVLAEQVQRNAMERAMASNGLDYT